MQCFASSAQSMYLTSVTGSKFWSRRQTKITHSPRFLSAFRVARTDFGVGGRTFFQFWGILFYFRGRAGRICRWRQNIFSILDDFVLLSEQRGPILESAVEHFFNFGEFYSTFEVARAEFVGGGRTFSQFWMILFYSRSSAGRICRRRQNIFSILDDFVLLSGPRGPNLQAAVEHFSNFSRFCSTFEAARPGF